MATSARQQQIQDFVTIKLEDILAAHPRLKSELEFQAASRPMEYREMTLVDYLVGEDAAKVISTVMAHAKRRMLVQAFASSESRDLELAAAKEVVSWLTVRVVNPDLVDRIRNIGLNTNSRFEIELAVAWDRRRPPELRPEPGSPDLVHDGALVPDLMRHGFDVDSCYRQLLSELWNLRFYRRKKRQNPETGLLLALTEDEKADLVAELKQLKDGEDATFHLYYLVLDASKSYENLLNKVHQRFFEDGIELTVVRIGDESGATVIDSATAGHNLAAAVRLFMGLQ